MISKAAYVRSQEQTREHHCHWPGCDQQVPPAMWGCRPHWFKLPKALRDKIWATYRPGQETSMTPSRAYLDAADEVQRWIKENTKPERPNHDGPYVARPGVVVSAYQVGSGRNAILVERVSQRDGSDLWAVRLHGQCLNKQGEWEAEPMPSSRDSDFLTRCRFATSDAAIDAALCASPQLALLA